MNPNRPIHDYHKVNLIFAKENIITPRIER